MERLFRQDTYTGTNVAQAVTLPGLVGYRFGLVATLRLDLRGPDGAPSIYEARSRLTRIYYSAGRLDASRRLVFYEADRANSEAILHQLRADPALFDSTAPR